MEEKEVILVSETDAETGAMNKQEAHQKGVLHRAFSVFIMNSKGEMLLQKRADDKYHSGGLWTNACCSHPFPGEDIEMAAHRRLQEELGFDCKIKKIFDFIYHAKLDNGLMEHEFDHVFMGRHDGMVNFDKNEMSEVLFLPLSDIEQLLEKTPKSFTAWFILAFPRVERILNGLALSG